MPCLRFTAASEEEINLITGALQAAGYIVTPISSREIEFELPAPEPVEDEERLVYEGGREAAEGEQPAESSKPRYAVPDLPREFVLAPLFRTVMALVSDIRFHVRHRARIGWSGGSQQVRKMWRNLSVNRRWKSIERNLGEWEERALEQPVQRIKIPSIRTKAPREVPVVSPQTADRIGWIMAAVSGVAALIVVWLGLSSHPMNTVMRPETARASTAGSEVELQGSAASSAPASNEAPASTKQQKASAGRTKHHAKATHNDTEETAVVEDRQDVVVRHFAPQRTKPRMQQVAGVKHFSDME